jgi:hypothetical protein
VLFEVAPSDMASAAAACGLLLVAAAIASLPPTFLAMKVNPVEGLRAK